MSLILFLGLFSGCAHLPPPESIEGKIPIEKTFVVTAYCPCRSCCNWERNWRGQTVISSGPNRGKPKKVGYTACGTKAKPGTIAADTTLFPFGTIMFVPGYGYGRVEDRGRDIQGYHIDVFFKHHQQALRWGRVKTTVRVWPAGNRNPRVAK